MQASTDSSALTTGIGAVLLVMLSIYLLSDSFTAKGSRFPHINHPQTWGGSVRRAAEEYIAKGETLIAEALKTAKIFILHTDAGPYTILDGSYVNDVKELTGKGLDFRQFVQTDMLAHTPGLQPVKAGSSDSGLNVDLVKQKLTGQLPVLAKPLSDETSAALSDLWSESKEWHEIGARETSLQLIARVSSRVFLGPELCRHPTILKITIDYTITSMQAVVALKKWSKFLRPFVHWFIPEVRNCRQYISEFREVFQPEFEKRQREKARCVAKGVPPPRYNDTIEWLDDLANGRNYDPVHNQIALSLAAIHTTSDLLCKIILSICEHPEVISALREEIVSVLKVHGWKKTSLANLKLLDSFIKETHRMNPLNIVSMQRKAMQSVTLSDGTIIPKGSLLEVDSSRLWNAAVHESPETFDHKRFLTMRAQPGMENYAQLVTTNPDHIVFGHGVFSCPGRFFAGTEIKIIICHILLNYNIRFGNRAKDLIVKTAIHRVPHPATKILVQKREPELDLVSLSV